MSDQRALEQKVRRLESEALQQQAILEAVGTVLIKLVGWAEQQGFIVEDTPRPGVRDLFEDGSE